MFLYRCVPQEMTLPDIGPTLTFGLAAFQRTADGWQPLRLVPDVSVNASLVDELAIRCTVNQLDPSQMDDVVEDAIAI